MDDDNKLRLYHVGELVIRPSGLYPPTYPPTYLLFQHITIPEAEASIFGCHLHLATIHAHISQVTPYNDLVPPFPFSF